MPTFVLDEVSRAGNIGLSGASGSGILINRDLEIRDTSEVKKKIDLGKYVVEDIVNPTKLVVVDQFPNAGDEVPLGTPVSLVFMAKDSIKVADIAELSEGMTAKYGNDNVKIVTDDIQANDEVKKVLDDKKKYNDMNATEKDAVKKFAEEKGIVAAGASEEKIGLIHKDLLFIHSI